MINTDRWSRFGKKADKKVNTKMKWENTQSTKNRRYKNGKEDFEVQSCNRQVTPYHI